MTIQIEKLADEVGKAAAAHVYRQLRSCLRCCQFNEQTETCLNFAQRPPARVIAFGCDHFHEEIPF